MAALLDGVMQRAISAGSEQVARQLSGGKITEQRGDGDNHTSTSSQNLTPNGCNTSDKTLKHLKIRQCHCQTINV